jgi:hypothetical protein
MTVESPWSSGCGRARWAKSRRRLVSARSERRACSGDTCSRRGIAPGTVGAVNLAITPPSALWWNALSVTAVTVWLAPRRGPQTGRAARGPEHEPSAGSDRTTRSRPIAARLRARARTAAVGALADALPQQSGGRLIAPRRQSAAPGIGLMRRGVAQPESRTAPPEAAGRPRRSVPANRSDLNALRPREGSRRSRPPSAHHGRVGPRPPGRSPASSPRFPTGRGAIARHGLEAAVRVPSPSAAVRGVAPRPPRTRNTPRTCRAAPHGAPAPPSPRRCKRTARRSAAAG